MTPEMRQEFFSVSSYLEAVQVLLGKKEHVLPRGSAQKLSKILRVHTSFVSLVFSKKSILSAEQLVVISAHFALSQLETEFLLLLHSRDGTQNTAYLNFIEKQISHVHSAVDAMSDRLGMVEKTTALDVSHPTLATLEVLQTSLSLQILSSSLNQEIHLGNELPNVDKTL